MRAAEAAGVIDVGERALDILRRDAA